MYLILLKLKRFYPDDIWIKLVEQAKGAGKISEKEYKLLVEE